MAGKESTGRAMKKKSAYEILDYAIDFLYYDFHKLGSGKVIGCLKWLQGYIIDLEAENIDLKKELRRLKKLLN